MTTNNKISSLVSEAFVYCWTDHVQNRLYIGSHKGSINDGYVCSSKIMMEEYNKRPSDFTRQIVAEGIWDDIRVLEACLLKAFNVRYDDHFYNQSNGSDKFFSKEKTLAHRKKISESLTGKKQGPRSEETKQKMRKPKSDEHRLKLMGNKNAAGVVKTPETIAKLKSANTGRKNTEESIKNCIDAQKKRYENPEERLKQSDAARRGWITRKNKNDNK